MNLWNLCILRFGFAVSSIRLGASAVMLARLDPGIVCSLITGPPVFWTLFLSRSHWNVFLPSWGICLSPRTWTSQSWLLRLLWTVLTSGPAVFALAVGGEQGVSRCLASQGKSSKKHMYRNWPVTKTPKPQNPKTPKPQNPKTPKPQPFGQASSLRGMLRMMYDELESTFRWGIVRI